MKTIMRGLFSRLRRKSGRNGRDLADAAPFKARYTRFKTLLESNSELLQIIADMEVKLRGEEAFGMTWVRSRASRAAFHSARMASAFDELAQGRHPATLPVAERLGWEIQAMADVRRPRRQGPPVLPHAQVRRDMVDLVGGKNAGLGEMIRAGMPVPPGFAVTTAAFDAFMEADGLEDQVRGLLVELDDPADAEAAARVSKRIQALILAAPLPLDLETTLEAAYDDICRAAGGETPVALRSSAMGEDGLLSFAGQYLSVLGVSRRRLGHSYKLILASLFTPRAISYRLHKGVPLDDVAMAVACLAMVDSVSSGVMYSRHPFDPADDRVLVNAVWGLGPYAVDGRLEPDTYRLDKTDPPRLAEARPGRKDRMLVHAGDGLLEDRAVATDLQETLCLDQAAAVSLANFAMTLEKHFRGPQDMEWARDAQGRLFMLQSRPLRVGAGAAGAGKPPIPAGAALLLEGGDTACPGVGRGTVMLVRSDEDVADFPQGGVLVAEHSSPRYVAALPRASAVVTEAGSVTGHMASLTREFNVPAIMGARGAMDRLAGAGEVTVDALSGRVYAGRVPELEGLVKGREAFMQGTPVHERLSRLAALVVPLNLTDPASSQFRASACRTVHDLMRLIHERSYGEMFRISDMATQAAGMARKLKAPIPLDLHVIDLGGGLAQGVGPVTPEGVLSAPLTALLAGMLHDDLRSLEPRPVHLKGFMSVVSQQMMGPPPSADRFGDRSYAIVSDTYLNFSSRVGYHYSVLDAYVGTVVNENYISFEFKGGAADETRRGRRARAIALILGRMDFSVEATGDRVVARYQKYEASEVLDRLDQLGRLLVFTRQMDMLMTDEASVEATARCFLVGNYGYCPVGAADGGGD